MEELNKEWFELRDHRRRQFSRAVWIPIYGTVFPVKHLDYPEIGHIEVTFAVGSAVIFDDKRNEADDLDWHYWSQDNTIPYVGDDGAYCEAESFHDGPAGKLGFRRVLSQYINSLHVRQVAINQDFLMAYGLIEEKDVWLRPSEGYEEVIRVKRDSSAEIKFVEVRAEYLKDYLAARKAALRLYYYRQRRAILDKDPEFGWPSDFSLISEKNYSCEVRCQEIDASGDFPGTTWAVFKAWRTDVDPDEDVPDFSGNDDEATATESTSGVRGVEGGRFLVSGEMWRGEWIEPAAASCRIGFNEPTETLMVQPDGDGARVDLETLNFEEVGKYLWFRPDVITALISRRGGNLRWYTRDTGGVSPSPSTPLHFGANTLGLVNAYAYDVARKPLWERRIWASHNCRPDGGVSSELLEAQMACRPASTKSPEFLIESAVSWLDHVFTAKFGESLLRDHHEVSDLTTRIHRFRGLDEQGLRSLAKDIVKFTIERINKASLVRAIDEGKSDLGTIKLLQRLLAKYTDESYAYRRMSPLFGVYDLRGADAHLSSSDIEGCYVRIGIDRTAPHIQQAAQMVEKVAEAIAGGIAFGSEGLSSRSCD